MKREYEEQYHRVEDRHWWFVGRRHLLRELVRRANPDRTCRILDVGCSGGRLIQQLRADGYSRVSGIDLSPEAIAQCSRNGVDNVQVMDAQRPNFAPESFDLIIASDVLEHLEDGPGAVHAWHRLLGPNGVLIVFVPAFMFLWSEHDGANKHRRRYRGSELQRCVEAAGFDLARRSYWNFVLFTPVALVRWVKRLLPVSAQATAHGDLGEPPRWVNGLLSALLRLENRLICAGVDWWWGISVMVIARKAGPSRGNGLSAEQGSADNPAVRGERGFGSRDSSGKWT